MRLSDKVLLIITLIRLDLAYIYYPLIRALGCRTQFIFLSNFKSSIFLNNFDSKHSNK